MQYPGIKVIANDKEISPVVIRFELSSSLYGEMDSLNLVFRDIENTIAPNLTKGDPIKISWGYDENYEDLFEGVISSINVQKEDVTLKSLDYSVGFNSISVSKTFVEETASNILKSVLSESNLLLEIEESDLKYKVFPIFNESAFSVLQKITKDVEKETAVPQVYFTRGDIFNWKSLDITTTPVMSFTTGENIIEWVEGKSLTTLIVPVFSGDIVTINESEFLVESAKYVWDKGGRTTLWVSAV
ncbi:hypothetical protein [uncultured Mediterranean phage]|nr:hypothetical protein [uncultured Mediterranean phage]